MQKATQMEWLFAFLWEHTGSNRGPSACQADFGGELLISITIY